VAAVEVQVNQEIKEVRKMVDQEVAVQLTVQEMMVLHQAISQANQANQALMVMDIQDIQDLEVVAAEELVEQVVVTQEDQEDHLI
jgi:archaellum biogenesis ATPase FlaH